MQRAAERTVRAGSWISHPQARPAGAGSASAGPRAGPATPGHNGRPRRTIGRLCRSDSPHDGCSLSTRWTVIAGATRPRSRSAVLRTPSAARLRSFPPSMFGRGQERQRGPDDLQVGRPEAPTTQSRARSVRDKKQINRICNPVATGICWRESLISLKVFEKPACACRYWVSIQYVGA